MAGNEEAVSLKITTTVGDYVVNLRLEDATRVLDRLATKVVRDGREIQVAELTAPEIAQNLAQLWMNRVIKTKVACIFGLAPGKSVAIRPQTIVAITGEVISPGGGVGFGSIEPPHVDAS
jgi:hypothetical protein